MQKELEELNENDQKVWGWIGAKAWYETKWEYKKELLAPYLLPHLYIGKRKIDILQEMDASVEEREEAAMDMIDFLHTILLPLGEYLQKVEGASLVENEDELAWAERAKDHLLEELQALVERGEGEIKDTTDFKKCMYIVLQQMWVEIYLMQIFLKRDDKKIAELHEELTVHFLDVLVIIGKKFYETKFKKIDKYE